MTINVSDQMIRAVRDALSRDVEENGTVVIISPSAPDDYTVSNQDALDFFEELLTKRGRQLALAREYRDNLYALERRSKEAGIKMGSSIQDTIRRAEKDVEKLERLTTPGGRQ